MRTFLTSNTSTSLQTKLAADAHLAEGIIIIIIIIIIVIVVVRQFCTKSIRKANFLFTVVISVSENVISHSWKRGLSSLLLHRKETPPSLLVCRNDHEAMIARINPPGHFYMHNYDRELLPWGKQGVASHPGRDTRGLLSCFRINSEIRYKMLPDFQLRSVGRYTRLYPSSFLGSDARLLVSYLGPALP
jgi:hypothetical protein